MAQIAAKSAYVKSKQSNYRRKETNLEKKDQRVRGRMCVRLAVDWLAITRWFKVGIISSRFNCKVGCQTADEELGVFAARQDGDAP